MKILLLSFYDLGKQPKIVSEIYNKLNTDNVEIDFLDYSVDSTAIELSRYDALGIYASMHTATVLATQFLYKKELPEKIFSFGLYAHVLSDSDPTIHYIDNLDSEELFDYLKIKSDNGYSFKETVPDRTIFPNISEYTRLIDKGSNKITGSVETTYGCKHLCTHCPVPIQFQGSFKIFSERKIIEDVSNQIELGAEHISFNDPDFFNGPKFSLKILEKLNKEYPLITYDSTIKVEHILKYKDYFKELNNLNMLFVISAFESTNDLILKVLDKNHTFRDLEDAIELSKKYNVDIRPTWMPFTPWTRLEDLHNIIELIENYELRDTVDPIQLTIKLLIPKHSLIINRPEIKEYLGRYDAESFSYFWSYEDPKVDDLQKSLFNYVVNNEKLDMKDQYIGLVRLIEESTKTKIIKNKTYNYRNTPKLSETWFCCSEPNKIQLERIKTNNALI